MTGTIPQGLSQQAPRPRSYQWQTDLLPSTNQILKMCHLHLSRVTTHPKCVPGTVSVTTGGSVRRRSGSPCTAMHDRKKFKSAYAHYIQLLGFLQVPAAATPGALNFEWPIVQRTCYLKVSGNSRSHIWHALTSEKGHSHPKSVASKCPVNCFISNVNYIKCIHYCKSKTA